MTTNVVPIPINNIITHTSFHLDEAAAVFLLRSYGEGYFPGVSKATLRFSEGMEVKPDALFDASKILPIGCAHGTRFNDKDKDGKRLPDTCTTMQVYKYLGLTGDTALERIVDEVLRCDAEAGVKNTELAELVKMGLRRVPNEQVWTWVTEVLTAIHSRMSLGLAKTSGEPTLQEVYDHLVKAKHFPDERCRNRLTQLVAESMKRREFITELSFITESLFRTGSPDARDHVRFALEHLYTDQILFWGAVEECKKSRNRCFVDVRNGDDHVVKCSVLLVNSDSPHAPRASRHQKAGAAGVTMVRNSKGQVGIFIDRDRKGVNLDDLAAMIRWSEWPKDDKGKPKTPIPTWDELKAEGVVSGVPQWYYFRKAQQLLNGSLSRPGVEPTEMASQFLINMAHCAFDHREVDEWKRRRGIAVSRPGLANVGVVMVEQAHARQEAGGVVGK